jgi:hypothetical protein
LGLSFGLMQIARIASPTSGGEIHKDINRCAMSHQGKDSVNCLG